MDWQAGSYLGEALMHLRIQHHPRHCSSVSMRVAAGTQRFTATRKLGNYAYFGDADIRETSTGIKYAPMRHGNWNADENTDDLEDDYNVGPLDARQSYFEKYKNDLLVINGIDAQTVRSRRGNAQYVVRNHPRRPPMFGSTGGQHSRSRAAGPLHYNRWV